MDKKNISLFKPGYCTFAMTDDDKKIITFSDNSDIVTDQEDNNITCKPTNLKNKEIDFVRRGTDNHMPYTILKNIVSNVTVSSNIEFKNKIIYGDGLLVYKKTRGDDGKIKKEEVLESEYPEIFNWLENNDYDQVRYELANDLAIYYESYVKYLFSRDGKKLVQCKVQETANSRISVIDDKTKKSEWHGLSAEWNKSPEDDLIVTPLLDRQSSLSDLKKRRGIIPNDEGITKISKDLKFIHNIRINTPGRFYYSRPYWWSIFVSGWYDFSSAIPVYKKALIKNQMTLKYVIYIKSNFWDKMYKNMRITEDTEKTKARATFLKELNDFLSGEENAGKAFVSEFAYDKVKGFEEKDIIVETLDNKNIGGEYIEDSEEVSNVMSYAMNVHPSIIGSSPGKSKSINGTEARELFIIAQAMMKMFQDATLKPLYVAKAINEWPKDIYFSVTNCQLTTTDQGTGAIKNTGITPETKEK